MSTDRMTMLQDPREELEKWAHFAEFYLSLTGEKTASGLDALRGAAQNVGQHAADYGRVLQSPLGKLLPALGAIGGGVTGHLASRSHESLGGKSKHEHELGQEVEGNKAKGEPSSLRGQLGHLNTEVAHRLATVAREHPKTTTAVGSALGAALGLRIAKSLMSKTAIDMGAVSRLGGRAISATKANPHLALGALGAVGAGATAAGAADPGHRLSQGLKWGLIGGASGAAAGAAVRGGGAQRLLPSSSGGAVTQEARAVGAAPAHVNIPGRASASEASALQAQANAMGPGGLMDSPHYNHTSVPSIDPFAGTAHGGPPKPRLSHTEVMRMIQGGQVGAPAAAGGTAATANLRAMAKHASFDLNAAFIKVAQRAAVRRLSQVAA